MSEKDTDFEKMKRNNSKKDPQNDNSIVIFNFSSIKQNANLIVSDYNLFKYDFSTKTMLELNTKIEPLKLTENKNINKNQNLNLLKSLNLEFPSSEKLSQENFYKEFMDDYETSFANFCEIDKNIFNKAYVNIRYKPYLDKFGNIKISIKNLTDLLKSYSPSLKLKIRRRFIKKYKKKKIFKTMRSLTKTSGELESWSGFNYNPSLNTEGLKLISLKKNLKITVKKNSDNKNNATTEKENIPEENLDLNLNNNLLNNINLLNNECILSNNNIKSSIFSFHPPSNNIIQGTDNIFNFSFNDQNQNFFNFNNINNINNINPQLTNNINNQYLNKKRTFSLLTPYTPYINGQNQNINTNQSINQSNKKNNNQINLNIPTPLFNFNPLISPQMLSPYKDFLTPSSINISQVDFTSPYINMPNDKFTFNNIRTSFIFNSLNNQSPSLINNNLNINPYNSNNNSNNKNENNINTINNISNFTLSPNFDNIENKK